MFEQKGGDATLMDKGEFDGSDIEFHKTEGQ